MTNRYEIQSNKEIRQLARSVPIKSSFDVIVVGGGVAGLAAAVSAGRLGADTVLIERNSFLGGTATAGLMTLFTIPYQYTSGFTREFYDRLEESGGAVKSKAVPFAPEVFKSVALSFIIESNVTCRFYTYTSDVIAVDGTVKGVIMESKSGREAVLGRTFIDATGDADMAFLAGAPIIKGREADGKMRPISLIFRMGNVNLRQVEAYWKQHPEQFSPDPGHSYINTEEKIVRLDGFFDLMEAGRKAGRVPINAHYLRLFGIAGERGEVFINTVRIYDVDGTDAAQLTQAEFEARHQMDQLIAYLRDEIPGFKDSYLIDSATNLGVRETRRIVGRYVLTLDDCKNRVKPDDYIFHDFAHMVPGVEIHSPDAGEGAPEDPYVRKLVLPMNDFFFPYRCLLPKKVDGMLVCGRCVSVTHDADSWTRGMPTCMLTGQAAGIAAALSAKKGISPVNVAVSEIRAELSKQGVDTGDEANQKPQRQSISVKHA
jgi:hypothetical protein